MKKLVLIVLVLSLCSSMTFGATAWKRWSATPGNWSNASWWNAGIPTINDEVGLNQGGGTAFLEHSTTVKKLTLGGNSTDSLIHGDGLIIKNGGTLVHTYGTAVNVGNSAGKSGTLTIESGGLLTRTNKQSVFAGAYGSQGTIIMDGGTIDKCWGFEIAKTSSGPTLSGGYVELNAGSLIKMGQAGLVMNRGHCTNSGTMHINGGTLEMWYYNAAPSTAVDHYIAQGWITAPAGESIIVEYANMGAEYYLATDSNKRHRVYATPEPATMALLGLGGLALIRRKK